jgi:predicted amidophosphoribosyltransferase
VHRLKYDGLVAAAAALAPALAPLVSGANVLVPVPRTLVRRHRYGIDPALELAKSVSRLTGTPVMAALGPPLGGRSRAGRARSERRSLQLTVRSRVPSGAVLVDDVVTTGATLGMAAELVGASRAVTVTSRILGSSWAGHRPKTDSD